MTYEDYEELTKEIKGFPVAGTNENGECVMIDHYGGDEPYFKVTTFQNNDWIRILHVYKNGNIDEIYEK